VAQTFHSDVVVDLICLADARRWTVILPLLVPGPGHVAEEGEVEDGITVPRSMTAWSLAPGTSGRTLLI